MEGKKPLIDGKDREILKELQRDCKQPVRKISRKLDLRVTTTYDRIRRMEKLGVIKGYKARIDPDLVGMPGAAFSLARINPKGPDKDEIWIANEVSKIKGVSECHLITGEYDLLLKLRGENISGIGHHIIHEIKTVPGVERTTTMAIVKTAGEDGDVPL